MSCRAALFSVWLLTVHAVSAQTLTETESTEAATEEEAQSDTRATSSRQDTAGGILARLFKRRGLLSDNASVSLVAELIDETIDQARQDQDHVRLAVREVNDNLSEILQNKATSRCERAANPASPSPALISSRYIRRHPDLITQWRESAWGRENAWVLSHPVVIRHPKVLAYDAVKSEPEILNYPGVMHYPRILNLAPVQRDPELLLVDRGVSPDACDLFVNEVRQINQYLLIESYSDSIRRNANLSRQIATRLEPLVEDSSDLSEPIDRAQFLEEYTLLMERFLRSKQFRLGFGAAYSYLPTVRFSGAEHIDLSEFQADSPGGADRLVYESDFTNDGFVGLLLTAKTPYVDIDLFSPNEDLSIKTTTPVQFGALDDMGTQILARSTITSTLKVDYDAAFRIGLGRLKERRKVRTSLKQANKLGSYYPKSWSGRYDFGVGVGVTGFRIENVVATDVRLREDQTTPYASISSAGIVESKDASAFESVYLTGYLKVRINDEFEVGIDYRQHDRDHDDGGRMMLGGATMQLTFAYYPTIGRKAANLEPLRESLERRIDERAEQSQATGGGQ